MFPSANCARKLSNKNKQAYFCLTTFRACFFCQICKIPVNDVSTPSGSTIIGKIDKPIIFTNSKNFIIIIHIKYNNSYKNI